MKSYIPVILLFVAHKAFAQFNSIEFQQELASVKVIGRTAYQSKPTGIDFKLLSHQNQPKKTESAAELASPPLKNFSLTSAYGYRSDPFSREKIFHWGIDLKTNHSNVFAMLHGKVISVGNDPLLGNYVKVKHGRFQSIYGHLSQTLVSKGENVLPGTILGVSGSSGKATGDHLHLSIKMGKEYVNPVLFIQMISRLSTKEQLITYLSNQKL